jgi:hypothetical protein
MEKNLRMFGISWLRANDWNYSKNALSIFCTKQTTKEWLILPIRGAPKCVLCVECEMEPVQNDTRSENCWGWSIVSRAYKSSVYIGTYIPCWHYTHLCITETQYIKKNHRLKHWSRWKSGIQRQKAKTKDRKHNKFIKVSNSAFMFTFKMVSHRISHKLLCTEFRF